MRLDGSCHCGAVRFSVDSPHPYPYQRCYCSIYRKTAGSGGYAINLSGRAETLVGTAAALGDAGSPASDSTLGPTAGLNADGQHDHIWDSVVPTFLHFNIPLIAAGWTAAMIL